MYTTIVIGDFINMANIIEEHYDKKNNTMYPIINELLSMLNDKITNRELSTTSSGYLFDSWYFWQKINYKFMGFTLFCKRDPNLTNWDCARILRSELQKSNKLADVTVEVLDAADNNIMVLINIGLREDGKPFN
jgi:hypothetical protein